MKEKPILKHLLAGAAALLLAACGAPAPVTAPLNLIPAPHSLARQEGSFSLKSGMTVAVTSDSLIPIADYLTETLKTSTRLDLTAAPLGEKGNILLSADLSNTNPEAYELTVGKEGISIRGASARGVIMGIATLRQLVPLDSHDSRIPYVAVKDQPRFDWRGMMLDVSRHFYTPQQVKDHIDLMARYKFNKFHWHLTDDQGWRIEIKQYPELVNQGAWRKFDRNDRQCQAREVNEDNPDFAIPQELIKVVEGDTLYGGYYTQDEIREVVAYAAARGIDVIPEIDMPGHSSAAMHGYPWLSCFNQPGWGETFSAPLCPGKDSVLTFAQNVYSELFQLFPYEYVHLGADEVEKINWKKCPNCQARILEMGLADEKELQAWFVKEMEKHFNAHGRKLIGWDEIIEGGGSSPASTIMWWRDWAPTAVTEATAAGNKVILSPDFLLYFDFIESKGDLQRVYETDPFTYRPEWRLTPAQQVNIWGMQANTWCEGIPSVRRMQYQMMPRMLALSELAWSDPEQANWEDFRNRFVAEVDYLDRHGINYRLPDLTGFKDINVFADTVMVTAESLLPNVQIRYTTDGSFPNLRSALYTSPIPITESANYTFRGFRPDGTAGAIQKAEYRKESYSPARSETPVAPGVAVSQHEYKGRKCAEIAEAKKVRSYILDSIYIPRAADGWLGLIFAGAVEVPEDGIYTFSLTSNDGSMLYVDGRMLIDNDGAHGAKELVAQRALAKGWHDLRIEYFDLNNGGVLELKMAAPGGELQPVGGFRNDPKTK